MNLIAKLDRRDVVQAHVIYDAAKKKGPVPELDRWDWSSADQLDQALSAAGYKPGILAGYLSWQKVELELDDLSRCAVVNSISDELKGPRDLGGLLQRNLLINWTPRRVVGWMAQVEGGIPFSETEPFILRPSVQSELPAKWYLEDGSGRATALVSRSSRFGTGTTVAYGFLGDSPDPESTFMRRRFPTLIK